jgi:hypothetical protein
MKPIIQSIVGGMFVMALSAILWLLGAKSFFMWVMAWPALILRPFFRAPSPDQVFPVLGGYAGIFTTLIVATLVYSMLIHLAMRLCRAPKRLL